MVKLLSNQSDRLIPSPCPFCQVRGFRFPEFPAIHESIQLPAGSS